MHTNSACNVFISTMLKSSFFLVLMNRGMANGKVRRGMFLLTEENQLRNWAKLTSKIVKYLGIIRQSRECIYLSAHPENLFFDRIQI